jgi:ABC-2 type transport system permease protein
MTDLTRTFGYEKLSVSWAKGFHILLRKELRAWWGTRRWQVQGLIWTLGLNGLLFVALFILPEMMRAQGENPGDPLVVGGQMFFALGMMAVSVGAIVLTQGDVLDEREAGTAAWILSKPVPRSAFLLSKLASNVVSVMLLMVLLPALLAFLQFSIVVGGGFSPGAFLGGLGLMTLHVLFYLTLTLMLGVLLKNRGVLLGVSLGVLLGGMLLRSLWPLSLVMPWVLPDLAGRALAGEALGLALPVIVTAGWALLFVGAAVLRFESLEL